MTNPPTNGIAETPAVVFLLYISLHITPPEKNCAIVTTLATEPIIPLYGCKDRDKPSILSSKIFSPI